MSETPVSVDDLPGARPVNTARAGLVSMVGTVTQVVIQLVSLMVLSRLLAPADFGLYAMAMTFIGFSALFRDMGLASAAVQAKVLTAQARSNLFWINTGTGLLLTLAAAAAAPAIGVFFGEPQVAAVVLLMSPTLLLAGISVQFNASLQRGMRFVEITAVNVGGAFLGLLLSTVMALAGAGIWALAVPQVIAGLVTTAALAFLAGWLPMRPRPRGGTRAMLAFGGTMFGAQVLTYLHRNFDVMLLGRLHGTVWTGHLNRATQITRMPLSMLTAPFSQIALAKMARHQDDSALLARLMLQGQKLQSYPLLLAAGGLLATADQIVTVALGEGWEPVAVFVRLVVLVETFTLLPSVAGWLLSARGMGRWLLRLALMSVALKIGGMLLGSLWGPYGIIAGNAAGALLMWPLSFAVFGRVTDVAAWPLLRQSIASAAYLAAASGVAWAAGRAALPLVGAFGSIVAAGLALLTAVGTIAVVVPPLRRDLREVWAIVKSARD